MTDRKKIREIFRQLIERIGVMSKEIMFMYFWVLYKNWPIKDLNKRLGCNFLIEFSDDFKNSYVCGTKEMRDLFSVGEVNEKGS